MVISVVKKTQFLKVIRVLKRGSFGWLLMWLKRALLCVC